THGGFYPNWEIPDFLCKDTISGKFIDVVGGYIQEKKVRKGSDMPERSPSPPDVKINSISQLAT
ncbi:MAG: hypothetical protein ACR2HS_04850, partial [Gammaproteobacteria bacterium]